MRGLAELFEAMTNGLREDREHLNHLDDHANGNTGDNMVHNFETVTKTLRQLEGQPITVDQALQQASQTLLQQGRGSTAPLFATGLVQAAQNLQGKQSFGLEDLAGLLGGLMSGAEHTQGSQTLGGGGLMDGLIPGVTTFMQSKQAGRSTIEALLSGFMASQRGAYSTTRSNQGFGQYADRDTSGRVDPGAAGAGSLLGGLLQSLLAGGLSAGRGQPTQSPGLEDLLGGGGLGQLFGGGDRGLGGLFGGGNAGASSGPEPQARLGEKEVV